MAKKGSRSQKVGLKSKSTGQKSSASSTGKSHQPGRGTGAELYQFKITLRDIRPAIWRRIQVPDGTLADLHWNIQAAFGWENSHLHQFEIDGVRYGMSMPGGFGFEDDTTDEATVRLSELISRSGRRSRWLYEYDFGDSWLHEIAFEKLVEAAPGTKYPVCVDGARACPPDDCGGPWGYAQLLETLSDPKHPEHEDMLEWSGPLDPDAFDVDATTKALRRLR